MRKLHLRKIANVSDLSVGGSFPQAIAKAEVISFTGNRGFFHCSIQFVAGSDLENPWFPESKGTFPILSRDPSF